MNGALIVGGGPAGAAAAITLARAGAPHLLIERTRETGDALCGGFLSWRTLETLEALGIAADDLNRDRITRVRLFAAGRMVETSLPRPALAVSRRTLDTRLLRQSITLGAHVERGVTVRAIDEAVHTDDGAKLAPPALFLASGKHDVRGVARPATARGDDPTLGLRTHLGPAPALDRLIGDAIELHLFDRGYVGIARQEDGRANLCLAVHRSRLRAAGDPAALLAQLGRDHPALADRLAYWNDAPIDAIANVPYGWHATHGEARRYRLGDQAGVIPSLAGEGMGIAIASGIDAAGAFLRDGPAASAAWQARFARRTRRPIAVADAIRALAERPLAGAALVRIAQFAPYLIEISARATRIVQDRA